MKTVAKRLYEGLFLVDSTLAASDWDGVNAAITKVLDKVDAEIVTLRKWDERRLAFEVKKKVRGTYLLCYFKVDTDKIPTIERSVQLSEDIMRVMILRTDRMSEEDINRNTPVMDVEAKEAAAKEAAKARAEAAEAKAVEAKAAEAAAVEGAVEAEVAPEAAVPEAAVEAADESAPSEPAGE